MEELTFPVSLHSRRRQRRIVGRCILKNNVLDKECGGEPRSTQKQGWLSAHWILGVWHSLRNGIYLFLGPREARLTLRMNGKPERETRTRMR